MTFISYTLWFYYCIRKCMKIILCTCQKMTEIVNILLLLGFCEA